METGRWTEKRDDSTGRVEELEGGRKGQERMENLGRVIARSPGPIVESICTILN